ncbi:lamin tail domain-containing protein [Patescibacteria group bacterium]|nr:lamin tail domain-containing protein [Patescibacteria group bacterium]
MEIKFLKITFLALLVLFVFSLPNRTVQAANSLDIVINEIAWMGTEAAYQDEWIELYNNTGSPLNLDGWMLKATDSIPEINLAGTVPANGFYLLERTDDTTLPDIAADQIYTGAMSNNGEYLQLFNSQNNLIDEVNASEDWPAGDNATKQTMERTNSNILGTVPENWQTSQNPGGTPKAENNITEPDPGSICQPTEEICDGIDNDCDGLIDEDFGTISCGVGACAITVESCVGGVAQICTPGTPTTETCDQIDNDCDGQIDEGDICVAPEPEAQPQPSPQTYPSGIFINELLPSPEGPDNEEEFIELYNNNSVPVNLSEWTIQDTRGSTKAYTFPEGTNIHSRSFLVLNRPVSKIVLNNEGEGLILKNPSESIVDSVLYEGKAPQGQSYAKKIDGIWEWTLILTPGEENRFLLPAETQLEPETQAESQAAEKLQPEPKSKPQPETLLETQPQEESAPISYPSAIFINEILPSPTGSDAIEEWIEIFNENKFEVELSGWQIQDKNGRIKTYTFPKGIKISPKGYLVLFRPTTKITLNNDGDEVHLIQPNGEIGDQVSYGKAPAGKSYNRVGAEWFWSDILTPGSENVVPSQAPEETDEKKVGSSPKIQEKGIAAIGQLFSKSSQGLFTLLAAIVVAIFSGAIILILKRKAKAE